jgi:[protein-PII] uridylyltransferase
MFWVRSGQEAAIVGRQVGRLEQQLRALLRGELDPVEVATGKPSQPPWSVRPTPPVATKVNVDNRSATNHTVIEVITRDRRALLFWLARTIQQAGLSIDLAKVNTEGERVADVFYVVDESRGKMDDARFNEIRERIFTTIARIESGET